MEDLLGQMRSGASRVSFEAEKRRRIVQAQMELRGLRGKVEEAIEEAGQQVVEVYKAGEISHPELSAACEEVVSLEEEIAQKEEEIEAIRAEEFVPPPSPAKTRYMCPECEIELPEGAKFCPQCGSEAVIVEPEPPAPEPAGAAVCPNCGAEITPEATFCPGCGTRLEEEGTTSA